MKTASILKQTGVLIAGVIFTAQAFAFDVNFRRTEKSALTLTMDKPVIEYLTKAINSPVDASDIVRIQRMAGQIDHVVVSFKDEKASPYVLTFQSLDEQGLEAWMFSEGYLESAPEEATVASAVSDPADKTPGHRKASKNSVTLTVDQPVIEYLSRIYADDIQADDIMRIQKVCCQIDHITVVFKDETAADYVLKFKQLDRKGLESWMFGEGYLVSAPEPEPVIIEPWMLDSAYLE